MEKSKQLLQKAGIIPDLQLAIKRQGGGVDSTGPHTVKLLEDKVIMGSDYEGKDREEVKYIVEENGEKKQYCVPIRDKNGELHYLIQRLSEINEGEEVILECVKKGIKNYISVSKPNEDKQTFNSEEESLSMESPE